MDRSFGEALRKGERFRFALALRGFGRLSFCCRPAWPASLWPISRMPKSIPQELAVIVPHLPSVPVQPLLLEGSDEYSMFEHFKRYPWVLETYKYPSSERLIADLGVRVIGPAEKGRRRRPRPRLP
jgi:hypothetical protein